MPKKLPTLSKLSRPRLHKAVARERLLSLLDQKREYPVVWISAPPGAGKTTLAASYVDEAKANAIWFQVDTGDSDPATFFYYVKQAIEQRSRRKAIPLQLFTTDYLSDIEGFARRFFRDAFLRLPEDALLVFDNYHEIEPQSPLHAGFAAALTEIPPGANILVLSRSDPPSPLVQAIVNQTIVNVSWDDLKLTPEEAQIIAKARGVTDPTIANELQQKTDGWVAGLTLMLDRAPSRELLGAARLETLETVFDYFAQVIFEPSSNEAQDVMLRTALLPHMTPALTESVTATAKAIRHIQVLYRRHMFVSRAPGEVDTYQYHTMFHSFLRARARASLSTKEIMDIRMKAAVVFESTNDLERAFSMFAGAQAWNEMERMLINNAGELISQGRWRALQEWVEAIPRKRVEDNSWVQYWLGRSYIWVDHAVARPIFEDAYNSFSHSKNTIGQVLAAAGILEAILVEFDYRKFHEMDAWIEHLSMHVEGDVSFPTNDDEIRVYSTLVRSCYSRMPDHPLLLKWLEHVKELAKETKDPNIAVGTASALFAFVALKSDEGAIAVAERLAAPFLKSPEVTPRNVGFYFIGLGYAYYTFAHYQDALDCYELAESVAIEHRLVSVLQNTVYDRMLCARRAGLRELAEQSAERFSTLREHDDISGPGSVELLRAMTAFDRADYGKAIASALAVENEIRPEGDYFTTMLYRIVLANIFSGSGKPGEAKRLLQLARHNATGPNTKYFLGSIALNEAWAEHLQSNEVNRDKYLREALKWAHDKRGRLRYHWFPNALVDLLPVALDRDIDPEMALRLARDLNITPRDTSSEYWPWPVKVYTLGKFKLLVDGQPPLYSRKLPKKALALLKTIIAFGGKAVPEQKLIDTLWPDTDGDAAQRSLSATVHRLRKLLGHSDAIRQGGGALNLDERLCWVDAFAFERQIAGNGDVGSLKRSLQLYRCAFLSDEDGSPWLAPYRERLRSRFTDAIGKLGASLEEDGKSEAAIALYSRGIEADNLIESFYQGLMRCHQRLDQHSEAMNAYRRLRDILAITLGVEPSPRSRQLMETLRQGLIRTSEISK